MQEKFKKYLEWFYKEELCKNGIYYWDLAPLFEECLKEENKYMLVYICDKLKNLVMQYKKQYNSPKNYTSDIILEFCIQDIEVYIKQCKKLWASTGNIKIPR